MRKQPSAPFRPAAPVRAAGRAGIALRRPKRSSTWVVSLLCVALIAPVAAFARSGVAPLPPVKATCAASGAGIRVIVERVKSSKGLITAVLYNDEPSNFLKRGQRLARVRVHATEGATRLCLEAPGPGSYAVALYHDENGNRKFDRNLLGIPLEGYGFSNDPRFALGPPKHEDVVFDVGTAPVEIKISLRYL